jgi:alpha-galactosidase
LNFGLWFEPERVGPKTKLAKEHPDWILWDRTHEPENSFNAAVSPGYGLLDYGRPDAQRWVSDMLERYIRDIGIKYIRYDFNIDPLPYWESNDPPNRRGVTQFRYVQGLYAVIDRVRARNPDTVLENCSSGGRRIDLEMARRFHTMWISDYTVDPAIIRNHLFGINHFLPGNYHYVLYTLPYASQSRQDFHADDLGFQSLFGGAFGIAGHIDLWPESMRQQARRHVTAWKALRRYLVEDYYPLSDQPRDVESWSGWQFNDPKDRSGFVQSFRTNTTDAAHRLLVKGLDERERYRFTDLYSGESFDLQGTVAMKNGIEFKQAPMTSRVFPYRKVSD